MHDSKQKQLEPVLHCHRVSKYYRDGRRRTRVLRDLSLSLAVGERVAILGSSGSGKSTLLHLLAGLLMPSKGHIDWSSNKAIESYTETRRAALRNQYLGMVYQFHYLLAEFNTLENVCMPLLLRGIMPKQARHEATDLLKQVGLQHRLNYAVNQLSGGERQRVAIARALVTKPVCLLADEPTGNLDQHTSEQVYQLLLDLSEQHTMSLLLVTHDQILAARMNRILQLCDGQLYENEVNPPIVSS